MQGGLASTTGLGSGEAGELGLRIKDEGDMAGEHKEFIESISDVMEGERGWDSRDGCTDGEEGLADVEG